MKRMVFRWICCVAIVLAFGLLAVECRAAEGRKTENVIFVMTDGLRWKEMFGGLDEAILPKPANGKPDPKAEATKQRFLRATPEESRKVLLPFVWSVVAEKGQIYGNQSKQSKAEVTNGFKFSYPGFSETLCGFPDPRIDSNNPGPNPNVTVLEWLHRKPAFQGRVAAFGAWDAFNAIINRRRCGFCVNCGFDPLDLHTPEIDLLNTLKREEPRIWGGEPVDALTFQTALHYFKAKKPRVFFLALGETDEWSHGGDFSQYLIAAQRADSYLKTLWELAQSMPEYAGKTTIIFSTDHGRGSTAWRDHGKDVVGAEEIWMAFMGPDTPALGERANVPTVTESQIAATLAALLGEDYCADVSKAGKPIADVLGQGGK